jgi:hypothetical protein
VDPDADSGTANALRTDARSYSAQTVDGAVVYDTPTVAFTRGDNYTLGSVIDVTLQTGKAAQITTTAAVTAPAPSGLILIASGVSFFGFYRRLRRSVVQRA